MLGGPSARPVAAEVSRRTDPPVWLSPLPDGGGYSITAATLQPRRSLITKTGSSHPAQQGCRPSPFAWASDMVSPAWLRFCCWAGSVSCVDSSQPRPDDNRHKAQQGEENGTEGRNAFYRHGYTEVTCDAAKCQR